MKNSGSVVKHDGLSPAEAIIQWERGVEAVSRRFARLDGPTLERLALLTEKLKACKVLLQEITEKGEGASRCADCRGACCASGRYHFTAADLLAYLVDREPLFTPRFSSGMCPFLGDAGCLIPPPYRPFNCITFNCEAIEDLLDPADRSRFYLLERDLREIYREIRSLFPESFMSRALLSVDPSDGGSDAPSHDGGLFHGHH